ncbi:MAG: hypothetical protein R3Y60_00930 [bacterium]
MKKIIILCVGINLIIYCIFGYFLLFKQNNNEVINMVNLENLSKQEVIDSIEYYELEFIYLESEQEKDIVLYTSPAKNELTQVGQKIKVYISSGMISMYYKNLINTYYEDNVEYFNELELYGVSVIVEKQLDDNYPDGVIVYQSLNDVVSSSDTFKIIVNYNNPLILVPNLIGKNENEVLLLFEKYDIEIQFIYTKKDGSKLVFDQSISPNTLIISGSVLYVYISI